MEHGRALALASKTGGRRKEETMGRRDEVRRSAVDTGNISSSRK